MNTAPHLRPEDRPDFERVLDEALRAGSVRRALLAPGARMNTEQLRTKALAAAAVIAAAAADEYGCYTALRDRIRDSAAVPHEARGESTGSGLGTAAQLAADTGAGAVPVMSVLAPILAWAAALIFLLLGYGLRTADPHLEFARALITAGWVSLAVGAVAMIAGIVGLLLTALRDGATPPDGQDPRLYAELTHAKDDWKAALKEHGILPYLHSAVSAEPAVAATGPGPGVDLVRRRPRPGFTSPGFTSPAREQAPAGDRGRSAFSSPDYSRPSFSSPDFTSPNYEGRDQPES